MGDLPRTIGEILREQARRAGLNPNDRRPMPATLREILEQQMAERLVVPAEVNIPGGGNG